MGLFRYILGGESRRNLKRLDRIADKVLALEPKYLKMTDEEWRKNIKNESNEQLLKDLIDFGVDMYYADLWKTALRELSRRLDVDYTKLGLGK